MTGADEHDDLDDEQLASVLTFDGEERYSYFVTTACANDEVFCLKVDDDWATFGDEESGRDAFPVWPHARLAAASADGGWADAEPTPIALGEWLEFSEELAEEGVLIAVMMYPDGSFLRIEPLDLKRDLDDWAEPADESNGQPPQH
jgi:hypothetical protein